MTPREGRRKAAFLFPHGSVIPVSSVPRLHHTVRDGLEHRRGIVVMVVAADEGFIDFNLAVEWPALFVHELADLDLPPNFGPCVIRVGAACNAVRLLTGRCMIYSGEIIPWR
jgi:hypothetical protein